MDYVLYLDPQTQKSTLLAQRTMREGILGKTLEAALQSLIESNPDLLPGSQIEPSLDPPPKFFLLRREAPIGSWSLDHLFVDQYGTLTLIETKLFENPQQRREVIGQIIEYAANARSTWSKDTLRAAASKQHSTTPELLDAKITEQLLSAERPIDEFWGDVERKLAANELRLIVAADRLNASTRRLIEFLSSELRTVQVLGLEITCYARVGDDSTVPSGLVVVPRVIGQTQAESEERTSGKRLWDEVALDEAFSELDEPLRGRLRELKKLAVESGRFIPSQSMKPMLSLRTPTKRVALSVYADGTVYLSLVEPAFSSTTHRTNWFAIVQKLGMIDAGATLSDFKDGRNSKVNLGELDENGFNTLLEGIRSYLMA